MLEGVALEAELSRLVDPFRDRYRDLGRSLLARFDEVSVDLPTARRADETQRLLIGSYFTQQFASEPTALFNPSVVRHPDQTGLSVGDVRIVVSVRGIGEGHVSTLAFRTGVWRCDGSIDIGPASRFSVGPTIEESELPSGRTAYNLTFDDAQDLSEQVVYPFLPIQGRGIEDVRLVEFIEDDGASTFRGTFTAFNGSAVRQAMLRTDDFTAFDMRGVEGDLYAGKGMALFPRRIDGRYAMLSRQDNENVWLTFSDDLHRWDGGEILLRPEQPWESIQMGNCGSPLEIDEGFLVLTHGVGRDPGLQRWCSAPRQGRPLGRPRAHGDAASGTRRRARRLRAQRRVIPAADSYADENCFCSSPSRIPMWSSRPSTSMTS